MSANDIQNEGERLLSTSLRAKKLLSCAGDNYAAIGAERTLDLIGQFSGKNEQLVLVDTDVNH